MLDEVTHLGEQHVTAPVTLARGLHRFRVRYIQRGGDGLIRLSWAVPSSREEFRPVPLVVETDPPPLFRRLDKALRYPRQLAVAWGVWLITGLMLCGVMLTELVAQVRVASLLSRPSAVALFVISATLLGMNLDVGLQPFHGWAPDEVLPRDMYFASASWFAGGWYHQYPPLPFYLFAIVNAPFVILEHWGRLSFTDPVVYAASHLVARGVILGFTILDLPRHDAARSPRRRHAGGGAGALRLHRRADCRLLQQDDQRRRRLPLLGRDGRRRIRARGDDEIDCRPCLAGCHGGSRRRLEGPGVRLLPGRRPGGALAGVARARLAAGPRACD